MIGIRQSWETMELRSGWLFLCSVGCGWKVRCGSGSPFHTWRRWSPLPVVLPGLGLFYSNALPQPAAWVTVRSWTGLSAQSAARQSDLSLQLPMWWGRHPWPSSPSCRHRCVAVGVCQSGVCLAHHRGDPWGSCHCPCVPHAPASVCVSVSAVCLSSSLQDTVVSNFVLPGDAQNATETAHVEYIEFLFLSGSQCP